MIGENEALAGYLVRQVPGFADSPELEVVGADKDRSDAVAGALGRYLLRLERKALRREADDSESVALDRAFEVFEALHADDVVVAAVETRLGPRSSALFRRWAV